LQMFLQWLCSHLLWPRLAEPVRCLCLALSSSPDSALSPPWLPAHQQAPRSKACRGNDGSCPAACRDRIGRGPLRSKRFPHHLAAAAAVPALPRGNTVNLSNGESVKLGGRWAQLVNGVRWSKSSPGLKRRPWSF